MKVSVLINNYNYGRYIPECLESLRAQTVSPDEVILYDDGSTDNSLEVASNYDFVTVLSFPNYGDKPSFNQANAINQAFDACTGDVICLLDSDDFFEPEKIESVKKAFESDDSLILVQDSCSLLFDSGKNGILMPRFKYVTPQVYKRTRWTAWYNPTSCLSFSRSYLEKVLPLKKDSFWQVWADVRLSRIAPYYGNVLTLSQPLTIYRRHNSNDSSVMNENHKRTLSNQIAHHDYLNQELDKIQITPINYKMSVNYLFFRLKTVLPKTLIGLIMILRKRRFTKTIPD
jgi:glycosyltransferase involved in cell wall biosynthesis